VTSQRGGNTVQLQEKARAPRVLAEDKLSLGEHAQHAQGDVLEVSDRSRADREPHQPDAASNASNATIAAPIMPAEVPSSARTTRTESRIGFSTSRWVTSLARPSRSSPAAANPPPITTSSGSNVLIRLAIPEPRLRPISVRG